MLTILVIVGARTDRHFLRRAVGIGSKSHCLSGADFISVVISSTVAAFNEWRIAGVLGGCGMCGDDEVAGISEWSLVIFPAKKDAKLLAVVDGSVDGVGFGIFR